MTLCLCGICLTVTIFAIAWYFAKPVLREQMLTFAWQAFVRIMRRRLAVLSILCLTAVGCEHLSPPHVTPLPAPPPEQPTCNLPAELHVQNWRGPLGEGSCVHASLKNHAGWHNDWYFIANWPHSDGEYASRLRQRLDDFGYEYVFTERYDPRFLDWCDANRHGAILWWKPAHCCTFEGWVNRGGTQYAAILDNNYTGHFELVEREQFIRLWAGYGGFALAFTKSPTISRPYKSYELN